MAGHAADAIAQGHADVVVLVYGSTTRADLKKGLRTANLSYGARGPIQFEVPYGHSLIAKYAMSARAPHARVRHDDRATRRGRGLGPVQRAVQSRRLLPRPAHDRRRAFVEDDRRPVHQAAVLHPIGRRLRSDPRRRGPRARHAEEAGVDPRPRSTRVPHHHERVARLHRVAGRDLGPDRVRARPESHPTRSTSAPSTTRSPTWRW